MISLRKYCTGNTLLSLIFSICAVALLFDNAIVILSNVLFIVTTTVLLLYSTLHKKEKLSRPSLFAVLWAITYLVRVIWLIGDPHWENGLRWLDTCLPFLFYPIAMQWLKPGEQTIKTTLTVFFYACLLFCLISLGFAAHTIYTTPITFKEWLTAPKSFYTYAFAWLTSQHPSFLSIVYLFALPVGYYLKRRYNSLPIPLLILSFIATAMVTYMTGARIGQILFIFLLAFIIIDLFPRNKRIPAGGVMLVLMAAGAFFVKTNYSDFAAQFQDRVREQTIKTTLHYIKEKPLLGVGTGGMNAALNDQETLQQLGYEPLGFSYPHIQYIGEIMHFGIVGAMALFITLGYLVYTAFRRKDFLLQSLLLILFIFMFTEQPFDLSKGINFALFFMALFMVRFTIMKQT